MNIEKVRKYNQRLFAVLGTILVGIAIIALVMILVAGISELKWMLRSDDTDNGILSEDRIEELQKENKRQQVISYDVPELVDTINSVYIIPVRHKDLNAAEYINEEVLGILDMTSSGPSIDKRYSQYIFGSFNNLIIYDEKNNTSKALFNERINFKEIRTEHVNGDIIVLITASNKDTYRDGVINLKDMKSLFLYSFSDENLRSISQENLDVQHVKLIPNSKDLIIIMGIDHDNDGRSDNEYEPSVIKKYDFYRDTLVDIIDNKLKIRLQKLLEGTNN